MPTRLSKLPRMGATFAVKRPLIVIAMIGVLLLVAIPALANHRQNVSWDQGYPMGITCNEGQFVRLRMRVQVASEAEYTDSSVEDTKLHTFLRPLRHNPPRDYHPHWDITYVKRAQVNSAGLWDVSYIGDYPYRKIRIRSAWVKYGDKDTARDIQIVEAQCRNDQQYPVFQNPNLDRIH